MNHSMRLAMIHDDACSFEVVCCINTICNNDSHDKKAQAYQAWSVINGDISEKWSCY